MNKDKAIKNLENKKTNNPKLKKSIKEKLKVLKGNKTVSK